MRVGKRESNETRKEREREREREKEYWPAFVKQASRIFWTILEKREMLEALLREYSGKERNDDPLFFSSWMTINAFDYNFYDHYY